MCAFLLMQGPPAAAEPSCRAAQTCWHHADACNGRAAHPACREVAVNELRLQVNGEQDGTPPVACRVQPALACPVQLLAPTLPCRCLARPLPGLAAPPQPGALP